jgi:predicted Zn-dependent protease
MYIHDVSGHARQGLGVSKISKVLTKISSKLTDKVPSQVEIFLGNQGEDDVIKEYGGLHPAQELHDYTNGIGQKIAKSSSRPNMPYRFQVVNSTIPNAFALPNAAISVTHGLLATMTNEAQLGAVLAHEIGHIEGRHSLKELEANLGTSLLAEGLAGSLAVIGGKKIDKGKAEAVGALVGGSKQLIDMGYSRQNETEADALGLKGMVKAGYNPLGMVQVMQMFQQMEGSGEKDIVSKYMSSHPAAKVRVEAAEAGVTKQFPEASTSLPFNEEQYYGIMSKYPISQEKQAEEVTGLRALSPSALADKVSKALSASYGGLGLGWWIVIGGTVVSGVLLWNSMRRE